MGSMTLQPPGIVTPLIVQVLSHNRTVLKYKLIYSHFIDIKVTLAQVGISSGTLVLPSLGIAHCVKHHKGKNPNKRYNDQIALCNPPLCYFILLIVILDLLNQFILFIRIHC